MNRSLFKGQWDALAIATAVLLAFSILFGGASREHALRLALVELASLPVLVLAVNRLAADGRWAEHRFSIGLLVALVLTPLIQLAPLPPAIWTNLPGRGELVLALELAGVEPGWAPLTLTPDSTWRSMLALTPPVAAFLAVLSLEQPQRERLVHLCLAAGVFSILLGAAQLASGAERLYVWATTRAGSVNGLFANRNHLASFILVLLPFAVTFGAATLRRRHSRNAALWFGALFTGLVVIALAAIRSRAGILLFAPVAVVSLLSAWIAAGRGRPGRALLLMAGSIGAAITAVVALALPPILARFDTQAETETRFERWPLVAETAQSYLPLGSGLGSFDPVYRSVEPLHELDSTFFNQAHNEYLEVWLEAGWPAIIILVAFGIWYFRRAVRAWAGPANREWDLRRAASIGIGVLLLHSVGDYPLRTATLSVMFALCCGLLEGANRTEESQVRRPRSEQGRAAVATAD